MGKEKNRCSICGEIVDGGSSSLSKIDTCKSCGADFTKNAPEVIPAEKTKIKWVELCGLNDLKIRFSSSPFVLKRRLCEGMFGKESEYVSAKAQCEFLRENARTWRVRHVPSATNPTLIDKRPFSEEVVLNEKMELSVGPLSLKVRFEWE